MFHNLTKNEVTLFLSELRSRACYLSDSFNTAAACSKAFCTAGT